EGKGLGLQFLRHIERSRILLVLLDGTAMAELAPREAYKILMRELKNYNPVLLTKPAVVVITKSDAMSDDERKAAGRMTIAKQHPLVISAVSGVNVDLLIRKLWNVLKTSAA